MFILETLPRPGPEVRARPGPTIVNFGPAYLVQLKLAILVKKKIQTHTL